MRQIRWAGLVGAALLSGACMIGMEQGGPTDIELVCGSQLGEALKVCAGGATVKGIDVSYWQGTIGWDRVKADGVKFAIARVSDGLRHPDTQFDRNWKQMKAQGIARGAYQFFRSNQDPVAQARLMVQKIRDSGGLEDADLPPVLDIETTDGMSHATIVARARQWLSYIEEHTGKKPVIYTAAFMSPVIGSHLNDYKLWVANWGTSCPTMPQGWSHWAFWQYTSDGSTAGIGGRVDTNKFNGDSAAMRTFALNANVNPPHVDPTPPATPPASHHCTQLKVVNLQSGRLNVRPGPNTSHAPLTTVGEFETAPILDRATGQLIGNTKLWLKIRTSHGTVGWVTARYVHCNNAGTLAVDDALLEDLGFEDVTDAASELQGRIMGDGEGILPDDTEVVAPVCGFGF